MAAKAVAESMLRLLAGWFSSDGEVPVVMAGLKGRVLTMVWKGRWTAVGKGFGAAAGPMGTSIDLALPHLW
jgi:hypothetical protein